MYREWETKPSRALLSSNAIDAGWKLRPTEEELKELGPEFNELWDRYFKDKPDKPVMFSSIVSGAYSDHSLLRKLLISATFPSVLGGYAPPSSPSSSSSITFLPLLSLSTTPLLSLPRSLLKNR